jgi:hypothetical protein
MRGYYDDAKRSRTDYQLEKEMLLATKFTRNLLYLFYPPAIPGRCVRFGHALALELADITPLLGRHLVPVKLSTPY